MMAILVEMSHTICAAETVGGTVSESRLSRPGGPMRTYHIAWWNLENLFDEENAVALGRRTDKVFRAIKNDIAGMDSPTT
jgi:hypothetical protein